MITPELLERSRASSSFRAALSQFLRDGRSSETLRFDYNAPPVKVERTLTKVLVEYADLPIESIEIKGSSGCEYFRGTLSIAAGGEQREVRFHWDCKWRAEQQGWSDYFGFADQARAAREFGWDCFRTWSEESVSVHVGALAATTDAEAVPV